MSEAVSPPASSEFATTMQQLSAEAAKSVPTSSGPGEITAADIHSMNARLENLEGALCDKIDKLSIAIPSVEMVDFPTCFEKMDEQMAALRDNESVNQKLFDSLHDELLKYRDNFLHESLQKPFIHDLVLLFDDLTSLSDQLRNAAEKDPSRGYAAQWRDNLENAIHSLIEILHRFEVKEIEPKEVVDREVHRVVSFEPADFPEEDGRIVMRVKRGFFWRGKLIRPEEVVAKRFG